MKKEALEKIEEEINKKTKLPQNIKVDIRKEVFTNITIAIIMLLYFAFLIFGSIGTTKNIRIIDFNIFSVIFLGTAISLFEIGYRKENGKLALYGIESLVVALCTLFLPYIIFELDSLYKKYYLIVSSLFIVIYYISKSIYISVKAKNKYMNDISDIKEIVKKEKITRVDRKDTTTKKTEKTNDIEKTKEPVKIEKETNKKSSNKKDTSKKTAPKKTTELKKKTNTKTKESENEKKPEETPTQKKRGRPKKEAIKQKEVKNTEVKQETTVPKKRGRPRKVESKI